MSARKPWASVHIDLDELWTLAALYGNRAAFTEGGCYGGAVARFQSILERRRIRATFFVVGQDLLDAYRSEWVRSLAAQGHEIANHSFTHPVGFRHLSATHKRAEIQITHEHVIRLLGRAPVGFRAPAYDIDSETLGLLRGLGYLYDASVVQSLLPCVLRTVDAVFSRTSSALRLYGGTSLRRVPNRPYRPSVNNLWEEDPCESFLEVPVTTIPLLGIPFTASLTLNQSMGLFRLGLRLIRSRALPLVFLLHGVDLVDQLTDAPLPFYKKIRTPVEYRLARIEAAPEELQRYYDVLPTQEALQRL